MPDPKRLIRAGQLFALAELVLALALLAIAGPQRVSAMLAISAVVTAAAVRLTLPLLKPAGGESDEGGGTPEDPPEPPWWPEFERELRRYERRTRRPREPI
jgi:hypothetical protein